MQPLAMPIADEQFFFRYHADEQLISTKKKRAREQNSSSSLSLLGKGKAEFYFQAETRT